MVAVALPIATTVVPAKNLPTNPSVGAATNLADFTTTLTQAAQPSLSGPLTANTAVGMGNAPRTATDVRKPDDEPAIPPLHHQEPGELNALFAPFTGPVPMPNPLNIPQSSAADAQQTLSALGRQSAANDRLHQPSLPAASTEVASQSFAGNKTLLPAADESQSSTETISQNSPGEEESGSMSATAPGEVVLSADMPTLKTSPQQSIAATSTRSSRFPSGDSAAIPSGASGKTLERLAAEPERVPVASENILPAREPMAVKKVAADRTPETVMAARAGLKKLLDVVPGKPKLTAVETAPDSASPNEPDLPGEGSLKSQASVATVSVSQDMEPENPAPPSPNDREARTRNSLATSVTCPQPATSVSSSSDAAQAAAAGLKSDQLKGKGSLLKKTEDGVAANCGDSLESDPESSPANDVSRIPSLNLAETSAGKNTKSGALPLATDNTTEPGSTVTAGEAAAQITKHSENPIPSGTLINTAKLFERYGQSELRVGIATGEFGNVDIRTSMNRNQFTAEISVERGELGKILASELPSLQNRLSEQRLSNPNILLQTSTGGGAGGNNQGSRQSYATQPNLASPAGGGEPVVNVVPDQSANSGRLDVHG